MKTLTLLSILILFVLVSGCHDANLGPVNNQDALPKISGIVPETATIGDILTISGSGFGSTQNGSYISFNSTTVSQFISWSDAQIKLQVPAKATSGKLTVTVNNKKSLEVNCKIQSLCNARSSYSSVTIGTQVWMGENLDVCYYRNGDPIPEVTDSAEWVNATSGAWCYYNNDPAMGPIYGKLYNWYAVNDPRGLAPSGWHIPSSTEWTVLSTYLGGITLAGGRLKEIGTTHWLNPNNGANNDVGFTALGGGCRDYSASFTYLLFFANWWSSTPDAGSPKNEQVAWWVRIISSDVNFTKSLNFKLVGASVRCVKD